MSKARVAVLHVVGGQASVTTAAKVYRLSRQHLHRLLRRYRDGGLQGYLLPGLPVDRASGHSWIGCETSIRNRSK